MSIIARNILGLSKFLCRLSSSSLTIYVGNDSIDVTYEKPDTEEKAYDFDQYSNAQMFVKGYANPIKLDVHEITGRGEDVNDPKYDVITSKKYKTYMNQKVISDALFGKGMQVKMLKWLIIGAIVTSFIMNVVLIAMVGG